MRDDSKVDDVLRFLNDIDFIEVSLDKEKTASCRRRPSPELVSTVICGDIMSPIVSEDEWDVLR